MRNRFPISEGEVERCIDRVLQCVGGERQIVDAFRAVASDKLKVTSVRDVKRHLSGIMIDPQMPWVFFDMLSALIQSNPGPVKAALLRDVWVSTGRTHEQLRITGDGRWQVSWLVDEHLPLEDRYISVDLYAPVDKDGAPIVPLAVIDYIGGGVLLLREKYTLPALAILLIALESVLWEILERRNHSRTSVRITYKEAIWTYRIVGNQLVITVSGADDDVNALKGTPGGAGVVKLRKIQEEGGRTRLACEVDSAIVAHIASETEVSREESKEKGLAEAIQRALAVGLLETLAAPLDETLYRLRNHLIHLPSGDQLDPPVPLPSGGRLSSLQQIQQVPHVARGLVNVIVSTTNHVYSLASTNE